MDLDVCLWLYTGSVSKKVEDVMPIATGHEREELQAEIEVSFHVLFVEFRLSCRD